MQWLNNIDIKGFLKINKSYRKELISFYKTKRAFLYQRNYNNNSIELESLEVELNNFELEKKYYMNLFDFFNKKAIPLKLKNVILNDGYKITDDVLIDLYKKTRELLFQNIDRKTFYQSLQNIEIEFNKIIFLKKNKLKAKILADNKFS